MPSYEYELLDSVTGAKLGGLTLNRPVEGRDRVTLRRRTVPENVRIAGGAAASEDPGRQVLSAYRRLESRLGNNTDFQRRIGHSAEAVKRAWSE